MVLKIPFIILLFLTSTIFLYPQEKLTLNQAFDILLTGIQSAVTESENSKSLAVYHFTEGQQRTDLGDFISNELTSYLSGNLERFNVLSRNKIEELLEEHNFQLSGLVDSSSIAEMGSKISAEYIGTGFINAGNEHIRLNFQLIEIETGKIVSADAMDIIIDDNIRSFIGIQNKNTASVKEIVPEIPEYLYWDYFTELDTDLWIRIQKDTDISLGIEQEHLKIQVENRQGVNGVNLLSRDFRIKTFAMEISFRNPDSEALWISLTVGNLNHREGASIQIQADIYNEYYMFRYKKKDSEIWVEDEENILDDLFGDEQSEFHRLKLIYDKTNKTAYGYVDDILISKVDDFSFNARDRAQVILSTNGRFKNLNVDFDDFMSSITIR